MIIVNGGAVDITIKGTNEVSISANITNLEVLAANGETVNITIKGTNGVAISGNTVNIEVTGARGATGATGTPAIERKLSIWRVRQNNNIFDCEFAELFNNTGKSVSFSAIANYNIDLISEIFTGPFSVTWNGGALSTPGYLYDTNFYLLTSPSYIFDGGSQISNWSYVIIEDLSIYLP